MSIRNLCVILQRALLLSCLLLFNLSYAAKNDPSPKTAPPDSNKSSNVTAKKPVLFSALSKNDMPSWLKSLDKVKDTRDSTETFRTAKLLSHALTHNSKKLQKQYRDHLKLYPESKGKITLKLFVTPPGAIDKVEIISCSLDELFEKQVLETVEQWENLGLCDCDCIKVYVQEFIFGDTDPL